MGNFLFKKRSPRVAHYQQIITTKPNETSITPFEETNTDDFCPICFEPVTNNYKTYCCHQKIHKKCLEDSYNITNHTCPMCRTDSLVKKTLIKFYINIQNIRQKRRENIVFIFDDNDAEYSSEYSEQIVAEAIERVNQIMSRNQIQS